MATVYNFWDGFSIEVINENSFIIHDTDCTGFKFSLPVNKTQFKGLVQETIRNKHKLPTGYIVNCGEFKFATFEEFEYMKKTVRKYY